MRIRLAIATLFLLTFSGCGTLAVTRYYVNGQPTVKTRERVKWNKHKFAEVVNSYR